MANNIGIHSSLDLYISDQAYTLVPGNDNQSQSLTINRSDSQVSLSSPGQPEKFDRSVNNVAGILGIIRLLKSDYLILIQTARKERNFTSRLSHAGIPRLTSVTNLFKTAVYTPTKFAVYPISIEPNLTLLENSDERYLLSTLKSHLDHAIGKMFFTYHSKLNCNDPEPWDLTNSLQRQSDSKTSNDQPLAPWKESDDRFFWNKYIQTRLIELASQPHGHEASKFILPVIFGFLEFKSAVIKGKRFTFGIVSRRSRYRAGTRYFTRGINADGHVSNFNETEMIFTTFPPSYNSNQADSSGRSFAKASFVQTRGSVPLFWTEINNLRYRPDLKIIDIPESLEAMKAHFDQQISIYGDQYLFNLVNSSGYEKAVKDAYEKGVKNLNNPRVHYTYFDFHQECKGLRFDRVQILIDQLHDELVDQAYFFQEFSGAKSNPPSKVQKSVVRTNCMDCLDRTNVLQSALAKWVLTFQLKQAGILAENESLDSYPDFMFLFRNLWADNADGVSKSYSGTPALKTDFTRLGIRTKKGAFDDGVNSVMRYVKNNFLDGPRQDSYDLFTGAWVPPASDSPVASLHKGPDDHLFSGPYDHHLIQAIILGFVIFLLIFISATLTKKRSFKLAVVSLVILSLITRYIFTHGMEFVNQPRLKSSMSNATRQRILSFTGPGSRSFESSHHGRTKINFELFNHFVSLLSNNKHSVGGPQSSIIGPNQSHLLDEDKKKRLD
ncbi:hypothetical protein PtA15_11A390 [Puccinia triticina]|uniref:SAC domain-containing protein n=1 Tax=Puccinia triticina TaxID=208348 RepID=A0ABY7CWM2_9BASI|nr:uncharacterized protein PtA15_11A390 [Puccinia triticina]WAQ89699.1 hypothetical protein PtA15_11A390 [Puccinia triticina]WAR59740.1 hypothetical protein PtB15_11B380 [Puccinia triticina]